ncbi:MAG TPA: methyltransferase domain-containing protein, partial [Myxococcales bacterium]|nr:methyltransferase domain-containing protein [Myxococcales bacterium]
MLSSARLFQAVALPYQLVTRHRVWERHCAQMATELPTGARLVVDLGCGPGNSSKHLRDAVNGTVIGIDPAQSMLLLARRRDPRLALVRADGGALPLRDGVADAVAMHSVLYLLPDRAAALREVARVLRPGGRALLLEPQHKGAKATLGGLLASLETPAWTLVASLWRTMSSIYGALTAVELSRALED